MAILRRGLLLTFSCTTAVDVGQLPGRTVAIDPHGVVLPQDPKVQQTPPPVHQAAPISQPPQPLDHWPTEKEAAYPGPVVPPELAREGQISPRQPRQPIEPLFRKEAFEKKTAAGIQQRPFLARHATDLLIFTSAAFLFPAHQANRKGLSWISFLFATQAIVCGIYHYCDQHRVGTILEGPTCSDATYRMTHLTDHGMAYFVMLQMGLLILGPEDPMIQRIVPNCCGASDVAGLPLHVVALTRAGPSSLVALLLLSAARGDHAIGSPAFHIALGLLCCCLLVSAKGVFWLLRPAGAAKALVLPQSWLRLVLCLAAVAVSTFMFLGMQAVANDDTKVGMGGAKAFAHSMWHVAAAFLAGAVLQALHSSTLAYAEDDFQGLVCHQRCQS